MSNSLSLGLEIVLGARARVAVRGYIITQGKHTQQTGIRTMPWGKSTYYVQGIVKKKKLDILYFI